MLPALQRSYHVPGYRDFAQADFGSPEAADAHTMMQQQLPFHGRSSDLVFPQKLHRLLTASEQDAELARIVSWRVHGRAFAVHDRKRFLKEILPE